MAIYLLIFMAGGASFNFDAKTASGQELVLPISGIILQCSAQSFERYPYKDTFFDTAAANNEHYLVTDRASAMQVNLYPGRVFISSQLLAPFYLVKEEDTWVRKQGFPILEDLLPKESSQEKFFTQLGTDGTVRQQYENGCAAAALEMLLQRSGYEVARDDIRVALDPGPNGEPVSLLQMKLFTDNLGLESGGFKGNLMQLAELGRPVILHVDHKHYVVLLAVLGNSALILDPAIGRALWPLSHLNHRWHGIYFALK